jgi:methionyl-tRNA synthetase
MSKSLGNVLDPFELIAHFGLDAIRYFLMREISFGQDGTCSEEAIGTRINADLANGIGNLASRSLSMIVKNCDGQIPEYGELTDEDKAMLEAADALLASTRDDMDKQLIHRALTSIIAVVSETDRYFAGQQPWALKKTDPARMATVLYVTAEVVRQIGILMQPFTPDAAEKLLDLVNAPADKRNFEALGEAGRLVPGTPLEAPKPVFPRYVAPEA